MVKFGPGLQNKQQFLFRIVDIATELYVMSATISHADKVKGDAYTLSELFCENAKRKINILFEELWDNSDSFKYHLAQRIEKDEFFWLEEGIIPMTPEQKRHIGPENVPPSRDMFH